MWPEKIDNFGYPTYNTLMIQSLWRKISTVSPIPAGGLNGPPAAAPTREDMARAADRLAVEKARGNSRSSGLRRWSRLLWLLAGPGILVFLGENDAPSMLSYAATGAQFGIGFFFPFIVVTFLMALVVQEMTVRLGAVTHRGHAELIFDRFGPFWGVFSMLDLLVGNFLTLVTEFIGIVAGLGFFGVPPLVAVGFALAVLLGAAMTRRYWTWERIVLALALGNGVFVPVALMTHPDWHAVGHALISWGPLPGGLKPNTILLMMADIGATVTPWMLFFQQGATSDKGLQPRDVSFARWDTLLGACLAMAFGLAAVLATAPLFVHRISAAHLHNAQFAQAIEPFVGHVGASLFALGLVEAGLVAAISISASSAYAFGEVTRQAHSLNRPLREAWPFYLVLFGSAIAAGALTLIPGAPLEFIVLIVNVIATLAMPPALLFLLILANDRAVMGDKVNGVWLNIAGIGVTLILILCGIMFGISQVFPGLFG